MLRSITNVISGDEVKSIVKEY